MRVETLFRGKSGCCGHCNGLLATHSPVQAHSRGGKRRHGWAMTESTAQLCEVLRQRLGPQVQSVHADRDDEVYVLLSDADVRPITEHLRRNFGARWSCCLPKTGAQLMESFSTTTFLNRKAAHSTSLFARQCRPTALNFLLYR